MTFDLFVLPFSIGLVYLLIVVVERFRHWYVMLPPAIKKELRHRILCRSTVNAIWEIIREGLLHKRLWQQNRLLGYMHMSFALGWFLLIVMGNLESRLYSQLHVNPPYYPIFLKFFVHDSHVLPFELTTIPGFFRFIMDFLLLFVLSGLVLALFKRSGSRWFGLHHTTKHNAVDRIALTSLWLIFPLRLLAESFTAGCFGGGGFLTNSLGRVLSAALPAEHLYYPFWWAYSFSLGVFFILLPYTRYMHIPAEIAYILLKHWGGPKITQTQSYYECGMQACSRCGVCLDYCQVACNGNSPSTAPAYFIRELRAGRAVKDITENCLLCGRCQDACPVGIGLVNLRLWARKQLTLQDRLLNCPAYPATAARTSVEVVWFAGCMTHLTPNTIKSVKQILQNSGIKYQWLDADGSICCGRPMLMTGREQEAMQLIESNRKAILDTGARILLTNCPICYKMFRDNYQLNIEIVHHADFILHLAKADKIKLPSLDQKLALHIPCELDRKSEAATALKTLVGRLKNNAQEIPMSELCCGGSLGSLGEYNSDTKQLCEAASKSITQDADVTTITACPLCKKTIDRHSKGPTKDIAEIVMETEK
ncbi:MAG TPA: (Fe-S)-binding protein [Bacteroidales bacterium]|nr:MAG: hypothetical protein A2X11_13795 [Bacteroidetes bacterium GWE2_42_24]OFY30109.1 MAG: hypothetical protein A2X09_13980 [Bacteroidetes bacterium GWF2_43_11]PKP23814.1 MAG: (Fe-S)-binding protein [Bacteroidetes bacterium HGW-Bacteroidetes-22]HAQ64844.1 (Fe-S)-binding protein [Bacteroidales bacterium]HBZ67918.1 (Fe-S)-binding protein [Bacteroidales bacterium]